MQAAEASCFQLSSAEHGFSSIHELNGWRFSSFNLHTYSPVMLGLRGLVGGGLIAMYERTFHIGSACLSCA